MKRTVHRNQVLELRHRVAASSVALLFVAAVALAIAPRVGAQVQDITAPAVLGHTISPTSVDVRAAGQYVDLSAEITDDLSGVKNVYLYLRNPSGQWSGWGLQRQQQTTTYTAKVYFGTNSENGTWDLTYIYVEDNVGNTRAYYSPRYCAGCSPQIPGSGSHTLTVLSSYTPPTDKTPPAVTGATINPESVTVSAGPASVAVEVTATDAESAVSYAQVNLVGPLRADGTRQERAVGLYPVSGMPGTLRGTLQIPRFSASGLWQVGQIYVVDAANNWRWYYNTSVYPYSSPALPSAATPSLDVFSSPSDNDPPAITGFDFSPRATDVSGSDQNIVFTATVPDAVSGTTSVQVSLISPPLPGGGSQSRWVALARVPGTDTWKSTFTLQRYSAAGNWRVSYIYTSDAIGNYRYVYQQELDASGFPTNLQVSSGLSVANATGTYGGATTLSATLTSGGSPVAGRQIAFKINGAAVGSATTGADGVATLDVSLGSLSGGTYYNAITASFAGDSGLSAVSGSANLTVEKAQATLALSNLAQTYTGGARIVTVTTTPAGLGGVVVKYNGSLTAPVNAGTYGVVASLNNQNYAASDVTGTLEVGKGTATVTLGNLSQSYDGGVKSATATTSPGGLPVGFVYAQNGQPASPIAVGSYEVTATVDHANYKGSATGTLVIGKAVQTITFSKPDDRRYGDGPFSLSATASSGLPVSYAVVSGPATITGSTVTITGAGVVAIKASQSGDDSYNPAQDVQQSFTVAKAAATITLAGLSHTYDGTAKAATATTTPVAGLAVTLTYSRNGQAVAAPIDAGAYAVVATIDDDRYEATKTDTLAIAKASQAIAFAPLADKTYGDAPFALAATSGSGLPVAFSLVSGPATISNNTMTITGAGAVTIRASQPGNDNYNPAADVDRSFAVAKASQAIAFAPLADKTYGDAPFALAATSSAGLAVSYTVSGPATISNNTVTITGVGSVTVTAKQAGDDNHNAAQDVERSFEVARRPATIILGSLAHTYDGSAKEATASTDPAGLGVTLTYSRNGQPVEAPTSAGTYSVAATVDDPNHEGSATGTLTIGKAQATVALSDLVHTYSGTAKAATAATDPSGLDVTLTYSQNNSPASPVNVGSYAVKATVVNDNYQGSAAGTVTINKATATVTLASLAHTFDGSAKAATATTSPANLNVTIVYSQNGQVIATPTDAGAYDVTATINNANYEGGATGTLTIGKAGQTIAFGPLAGKTYAAAPFTVAPVALSATSSSGLAVTFNVVSGPATISGNVLAITGPGVVVVKASQPGNGNYNAAADVEQSFAVRLFTGFLSPVDNLPVTNSGRSGRTYPIKWQLRDAGGNFVGDLATFQSLTSAAVSCESGATTDALEEEVPAASAGGTALRYDATANQFIFNWQTASNWNGCRLLKLKLNDGTELTARFSFKR